MTNIGSSSASHLVRLVGLASVAVMVVFTAALPRLRAQPPARSTVEVYPESSHLADTLLRSAAQHTRDQQWGEAIEIYQRAIQQFADKVTRLPKNDPAGDPSGESWLFVDVRHYCQRQLAGLPADARAQYRSRVDSVAERWYRQGVADRDRASLRRVVEEAFCSSWGDDALDLLGDLAFEDGLFAEALSAYRQLVPDGSGNSLGLIHPDPSVDLARVAAKKLLCRAALGDDPPTGADLDAFAAAYPNAAGSIAGRTGPLVKILSEALTNDHLPPPTQLDERWPTFAGSPTRSKIAPGSIDVGSFQWKVPLELQDQAKISIMNQRGFRRGGVINLDITRSSNPDRPLAYHPIVLDDQVIVCDDKQIRAYNLNDRPTNSHNGSVDVAWKHEQQSGTTQAARSLTMMPRYTLTAFGDRIYARLGTPGPAQPRPMMPVESVIVAVDRSTDGKLLWKRQASDTKLPLRQADASFASFEGSPVADARSVYVALTEGGVQTATYVACLDANTGTSRWVRFICQSNTNADNGGGMAFISDLSHRLLSLDGSTVYYQTNLGAVAALDIETGRMRWLATYPRVDRNGANSGHDRDLNPAIIHDGLVIIAPEDSTRIFAFDALTGRLVWNSEPRPDVTHLLGVAKGRLVATGDHVWCLDVRTGKVLSGWPDGPGLEGYGRGLLAGDQIYWPTKTEIHMLDQATGQRSDRPPIKLQEMFQTSGGNLAVGDGYLIVAQPDALVVFCQNSRLMERYREEIARSPGEAAPRFRLAQAAEATKQEDVALENLAATIRLARPSEQFDGQPLMETARDHQFRLLMKLAARAAGERDWAQADRRYEEAALSARVDRDRLGARFRLAEVQAEGGDPNKAVATLQALLADDRLRPLKVAADEHRTVRADLLITDRLEALLRAHGRALYAMFDQEAELLLERGKAEKDPRLLEEVAKSYPVAEAVPASLLALAQLWESLDRASDAAHAYKRLLASAVSDGERARALWGLARAYETQQLWVPARDTYVQALSRFAGQRLDEAGTDVRLGDLVTRRLSQEPFAQMMADMAEPRLPFPLIRRWRRRLETSVRPLGAEGVPPSSQAGRIFLTRQNILQPVDPRSGVSAWTADLGDEPIWVGYLADRVIAATSTRVVALSLENGTIAWQSDPEVPRPVRRVPNPFAKAEPAGAEQRDEAAGRLHDLHIVGGRVFCLRGDRELLALDGDTGLVEWSYSPTSGEINPHVWFGPHQIVLQTRNPSTIVALGTSNGRSLAEFPESEDKDWLRDPFPVADDQVALVVDQRTVGLFDLKRGVFSWSFHESPGLPRYGPPRVLGNSERLLVLYDGDRLIRLDPRTGGRLWYQGLGPEDLSERPESMALDGDRFFFTSGHTLVALALTDGVRVWQRHLTGPETGWAIALTDRCVAAYPNPSRSSDMPLNELPLVFCRRETGELVQRILFSTSVSDVAVRLAPHSALVATQAGLWALGDRAVPVGVQPP
jgi:outer membrane protein assembly factor BamB/tetratricopeptide (TPR) repeat protein